MARDLASTDRYYASPFTKCVEHTTFLLDATEAKKTLTIVVRVMLRPPDDKWRGFAFFQKKGEHTKLHNWCFLIEEIVEGEAQTSQSVAELEAAQPEPVLKTKTPAKKPRRGSTSIKKDESGI